LEEDSLKIYFYNETTSTWEALNSIINKEENYVEVKLTHFSTYGIFGDEPTPLPISRADSKGSSKSSNNDETTQQESIIVEQPIEEEIDVETKPIEKEIIGITETKPESNIGITGRAVKFEDLKANPLVITILIIAILLIIAHHFRDRIKKSYPFFKSKEQQHKQHTEDHNTNDQPKTM
jgi:hypothetical protein